MLAFSSKLAALVHCCAASCIENEVNTGCVVMEVESALNRAFKRRLAWKREMEREAAAKQGAGASALNGSAIRAAPGLDAPAQVEPPPVAAPVAPAPAATPQPLASLGLAAAPAVTAAPAAAGAAMCRSPSEDASGSPVQAAAELLEDGSPGSDGSRSRLAPAPAPDPLEAAPAE